MKTIFFSFSFLFLSFLSWGQTIINPGDLVILGVNSNLGSTDDEISFACFKDITTGTNIQITDLGYEYAYLGKWEDGYSTTNVEGGAILTRTGGTIPAGSVITFHVTASGVSPYIDFLFPYADWSIADLGADAKASEFNISNQGDQIFFAQDGTWTKVTSAANSDMYPGPSGRMLFAFSTTSGWVPFAGSHSQSALFPGLECYNMAPVSASKYNKYTGPLTLASQKEWINRIKNISNWTSYATSANYFAAAPNLHTIKLPINIVAGTEADWTSPGTVCGSSIDLNSYISGSGIQGGTWSGTGVTGSTFNPSGLSGKYNITYTVGCPCCISQTHEITVTRPSASWGAPSSPLCQSSMALNLNTLLDVAATTGGTWSGNGVTGNTFNPSGLSGNINITYTVGTAPCSATENHTIIVTPTPSAAWVAPSSLCQSSAALNLNNLLTGTSTPGGIWSGNGVTGNTFNPLGLSGNINITYTVGTAPCSATENHTISVTPTPSASWAAPLSLCQSSAVVNLNNLLAGTSTTGGTWSGNGVTGNTFNPLGLSGNINITYTVGTAPCSASESHTISVTLTPSAAWAVPSVICKRESSFNLNSMITGTQGGQWSGDGITSNIIDLNSMGDSLAVSYTVNSSGCISTQIGMLHFSYVNADFTISPAEGFAPLTVTTTNLSQNAVTYYWDFSNGYTSREENPSSIFLYEDTYPVCLVATSALGCVDSTFKTVVIEESGDYIPNAITLDGDNVNDQFYPVITKLVDEYHMMIYNQWGNLLFETTNPSDKWDGTYQGNKVQIGVYVYVITYHYMGRDVSYHGIITVLD